MASLFPLSLSLSLRCMSPPELFLLFPLCVQSGSLSPTLLLFLQLHISYPLLFHQFPGLAYGAGETIAGEVMIDEYDIAAIHRCPEEEMAEVGSEKLPALAHLALIFVAALVMH